MKKQFESGHSKRKRKEAEKLAKAGSDQKQRKLSFTTMGSERYELLASKSNQKSEEREPAEESDVDQTTAASTSFQGVGQNEKMPIMFESSNGILFFVPPKVVDLFRTITDGILLLGLDPNHFVADFVNVDGLVLSKLVQWAKFHVDDHQFVITEWDEELLDIDLEALLKLWCLSNYLLCQNLCFTIEHMIAGLGELDNEYENYLLTLLTTTVEMELRKY
ncbi:hypothetical protein RN001_016032 [Aquatica leii]|uniref:SKP1 component POZ domain-containing protein n=1 Tax=Aquatica leii TaxID=1421715 RepID=A0AAN7QB15_9COLE|nr:hypothetical protein RN001_016032 [Aquatica leii]